MKKTVSLLMAFLMVLSIGILPSFAASEEILTVCTVSEEDLPEDVALANKPEVEPGYGGSVKPVGNNFKTANGVVVRKDDNGNKYFELAADTKNIVSGGVNYYEHKLGIVSGPTATANETFKKFTAKVKLPSVEASGSVYVFAQTDQTTVGPDTSRALMCFGVRLTAGQAQYYDKAKATYVNFLNEGVTMNADEWYTIEAYMDARAAESESKTYMDATIYDEAGNVIGRSDWQYVQAGKGRWAKVWWSTVITAAGYAEGTKVLVDEFKEYVVDIEELTCTSQVLADDFSSATFTFSADLNTDTITKENIIFTAENPNLDVTDKYEIDYTDGVMTITFDNLPYGENYNLTLTSKICSTSDDFGLAEVVEIPFATPVDPLAASLSTVDFAAAEGSVTASITLSKPSAKAREYLLLATSWNGDNECVEIKSVYGVIAAGATENITIGTVAFEDADSIVRVSLLDNWKNIAPIGSVVIYTQQ
ncbi:MAG: hypothetical protein IKW59_05020 [Clostridia bacterium]|nr:hypothetical protein [Clostridia bacterium]